eukprot:SAG31_NODE_38375_length_296_cov_1.553299_1_plen_26_part_10
MLVSLCAALADRAVPRIARRPRSRRR